MIMNFMMMSLSVMFVTATHPVMLLIVIMIQSAMITVFLWINISSTWMSLILFLIFIGGMMVLFVYIVSLASNETFNTSNKSNKMLMAAAVSVVFLLYLFNKNYNWHMNNNLNSMSSFNKLYSSTPMYLVMLSMIYLLMTLIVAVKISNLKEAPIKNTFYW